MSSKSKSSGKKKGRRAASNAQSINHHGSDEEVVAAGIEVSSIASDLTGKEVYTLRLRTNSMNEKPGKVIGQDEETGRYIVELLKIGENGAPVFTSAKPIMQSPTWSDIINIRGIQMVRKLIKRENLCLLSYAHGSQLLGIYASLFESFALEVDFSQRRNSPSYPTSRRHDFEILCAIVVLVMERKSAGSLSVGLACWHAVEKVLPIMRLILGPSSMHEAAVLMIQLNSYEGLDPQIQRKLWHEAEQYAKQLQFVCASNPAIASGEPLIPPLPYWNPKEDVKAIDRDYLESEALNHWGSALQALGKNSEAVELYEGALSRAERGGHLMLVGGVCDSLGSVLATMAAPAVFLKLMSMPRPGERRHEKSCKSAVCFKNPELFDVEQSKLLNQALRLALRNLKIVQEHRGVTHESTGHAHMRIAEYCWTCRLRKHGLYHAERALRIITGVFQFQPGHPLVQGAAYQHQIFQAIPTAAPVALDDDVAEGLSRGSHVGSLCDNPGCDKVENTTDGKFMTCSRCRSARYCGTACQKANWSQHKKSCAAATEVADYQLSDAYKAEQKRLNELAKREADFKWKRGGGSGGSK